MQLKHKVLLVTSSGGGGLLQAAKAKEQEIVDAHPNAVILERDVMKHWIWRPLGRSFVALWNRAQMRGDVSTQTFFGGGGLIIAECIFWPHIFFYSLYTLFKEKIDRVIDTQIFGTSAMLKAIRIYNKLRGMKVVLEKVLVDLPTRRANHFFQPIRALSEKDRKLFRLVTIAPLLQDGESEEEFWKKHCRLTPNELCYEEYYVRRAFRKARHLEEVPSRLFVRAKTPQEREAVLKVATHGKIDVHDHPEGIQCTIGPDVCVLTLLLGSQPANNATLEYVQQIALAAARAPHRTICLFVFLAEFRTHSDSLFAKVLSWFHAHQNFPKNLTIVPMSFQQDDVIAPLFVRSNATCTRSGGQTAMELMAVSRGKIWIHSEAKGPTFDRETLLKGIPVWESENAVYLEKARGANLVTPELISLFLDELLENQKSSKTAS